MVPSTADSGGGMLSMLSLHPSLEGEEGEEREVEEEL